MKTNIGSLLIKLVLIQWIVHARFLNGDLPSSAQVYTLRYTSPTEIQVSGSESHRVKPYNAC